MKTTTLILSSNIKLKICIKLKNRKLSLWQKKKKLLFERVITCFRSIDYSASQQVVTSLEKLQKKKLFLYEKTSL